MNAIDVINLFIRKRAYRSYLEIGTLERFSHIAVPLKDGLNLRTGRTIRTHGLIQAGGLVHGKPVCDVYFAQLKAEGIAFDIIYLDGDRHHEQVYRDIEHALELLADGGILLLQDCYPVPGDETNTAWRAFVMYRERTDLDAIVGDFDGGIGLIRKITNPLPLELGHRTMAMLDVADYQANRDAWMRPQAAFVFEMIADRPWGPPSVAMLVIGKNDEEIAWFKAQSPNAEQEARIVYVSNPSRRYGATAAIANPFFDEATEDVVAVVHADTTFAPGAIGVFARAAIDNDCVTGIVGRVKPIDGDPKQGYTWCRDGGGFVSTLDSSSAFMRRSWGFRIDGATFDDFHCVVEDLCLQARRRGIRSLVPHADASHVGNGGDAGWNDNFWRYRQKLLDKYPGEEIHTV